MKPSQAMKRAKKWHKENHSVKNVGIVKRLLREATKTIPYSVKVGNTTINTTHKRVDPLPILHNKGEIILQFCGWSINLLNDGTWYWEDTTGG